MSSKQPKLLTVASNGQISIGKSWAGRQILIEEVAEGELHIRAGVFVADSQKTFHSNSAKQSLAEFNEWEKKRTATPSKSTDVLNRLRKQKQARGK